MAKVMISLPDELLERVDREAARRGSSRSAFLQEGAWRLLGRPDPESFDAAVGRARAALADVPPFDSTQAIRSDRDARAARDRRRL